ncbi:GMC oxidoreductase [Streptomyces sp. enrichment culture]|uniref:GMC oxidoreductase n=1 Tax=Streptomyces sp. enrichment culture TaxID=1795815 RepID=UPI003F57ABA0
MADHAFMFGAVVLAPMSRGKVSLRSALPSAKPRVLHNYLSTEEDRATMIRALRMLLDIAAQPGLAKHRRADFRVPSSTDDAGLLDFPGASCNLSTTRRPVAPSAPSWTPGSECTA